MRPQRWETLAKITAVATALALVGACSGTGSGESAETPDAQGPGSSETQDLGTSTEQPGSGEEPEASPQPGGVAVVDWVADPSNLDPLKFNSFANFNTYSLVYSTLYRWGDDGEVSPELATELPDISDDGLEYTITLRDDVTWHDGSPFSAEDVAFTIETVLNPENGSTWYAALSPIDEVEVNGPTELTLTLERQHEPLVGMLAQIPIISSSQPYVPDETWTNTMMGTGPFKFVEWKRGHEVVLERNPDYFKQDLPYLDGVVIRTVKEDAARIANISGGNSTIMPMVPYNQIENLEGRGATVTATEGSAILPVLFPSHKDGRVTANADFRKAIAMAIDRGAIIDNVFEGNATSSATIMSRGTQYWDEGVGTAYGTEPDIAGAQAALQSAGVEPGQSIEIIVRNEPQAIAIGTIVQANLLALGLDVTLTPEEAASYLSKFGTGDFDFILVNIEVGLSSGYTPMYVYSALHSSSPANYIGYQDPEMDALLEAAVSATDDPAPAWKAVMEHDLEVTPYVMTVTAQYVEGVSSELQGYTSSPLLSLRGLESAYLAP